MILHLEGEVNSKMMENLVKSLNDLKENDNLTIYFCSYEGGIVSSSQALVDCINNNAGKINIIFYGELISCGMYIFLETICEKSLLPATIGMYHLSSREINIKQGGIGSSDYDKFYLHEMKKSKIDRLKSLQNASLTEEELTDIKNGKEVFFSYKRLLQLL